MRENRVNCSSRKNTCIGEKYMDILLWHKLLGPYELAVQELVLKFDI